MWSLWLPAGLVAARPSLFPRRSVQVGTCQGFYRGRKGLNPFFFDLPIHCKLCFNPVWLMQTTCKPVSISTSSRFFRSPILKQTFAQCIFGHPFGRWPHEGQDSAVPPCGHPVEILEGSIQGHIYIWGYAFLCLFYRSIDVYIYIYIYIYLFNLHPSIYNCLSIYI